MSAGRYKQTAPGQSESSPAGDTTDARGDVICSLLEDDDHPGAAVLVHSILKAGFIGRFWLGYRGNLPYWASKLERRADGLYVAGDALLGLHPVLWEEQLSSSKPEFMRLLIDQGLARRNLWYFDPKVTVRGTWSFFERWIAHGVCLCQENNMGIMPENHPLRLEWVEVARAAGWDEPEDRLERYFSSGFVGLHVMHRRFLETWSEAIELAGKSSFLSGSESKHTRANPFYLLDQDTMNLAAMYSGAPLTTIGPEGLGWVPGGFTMYHAGSGKPWQKKFLVSALMGNPPSNADKHFLSCADGPLHPFTSGWLRRRRLAVACASLVGRFHRRY